MTAHVDAFVVICTTKVQQHHPDCLFLAQLVSQLGYLSSETKYFSAYAFSTTQTLCTEIILNKD